VVQASHQGKPIASAVFFQFGSKALYKYGASDPDHQELRANNLVMWEAMKRFSERSLTTLCFGRTDMDHDGLRQFKLGWGTEEHTINYYRHDLRQNAFISEEPQVNGFSKTIFGKLPVPVLNAIGSLAYRHMG
jgi:lipid II:glycine glycyltransferase (peptidoglycan interpeptide bridge formation enzyme)